jgi:hypothetical protein
MNRSLVRSLGLSALIVLTVMFVMPRMLLAHCDTMDGPVIKDAQTALEKKDITPILKWVKKDDEPEIRAAFEKTLEVRKLSPQAKDFADRYFFETLVRVHRAGEGAPFTGLKPAGTEVEPPILAADKALETGNIDDVVKQVTDKVANGIRDRYAKASELKKHMNESVDAGREYVEAYVTFIHYVERLDVDASTNPSHHSEVEPGAVEGHHEH